MRRIPKAMLRVSLGLLAASCGGGNDRVPFPTAPAPPPTGLASGATLTFVSGETGAPVAGATVTIGGQAVTSDAGGQVRLAGSAPFDSAVEVSHPGYLERLTRLRAGGSVFTLWPRTTPDGLTEHYTATLLYTRTEEGSPVGDAGLIRLARGTSLVVVVPSPELLDDGPAMAAHHAAVAAINQVAGGTVTYALAPTRPKSGVVFTTRVDPLDQLCVEREIGGYMRGAYRSLELTGGEVVYCESAFAHSFIVAHELGHTFGLGHSPDRRDVMYGAISRSRADSFGPRESLLMRLMMDRPAGNRFPDNDRAATAAAAVEERVTVCY